MKREQNYLAAHVGRMNYQKLVEADGHWFGTVDSPCGKSGPPKFGRNLTTQMSETWELYQFTADSLDFRFIE